MVITALKKGLFTGAKPGTFKASPPFKFRIMDKLFLYIHVVNKVLKEHRDAYSKLSEPESTVVKNLIRVTDLLIALRTGIEFLIKTF